MPEKRKPVDELDAAPDPRAEPPEHVPAVANPAAADVIFFDFPLAYIYAGGMGSITLTTTRQLVDTAGRPYEDRIVTGILKAPLQTLQHLRAVIDDIERRANEEAVAIVAALERPPGSMAH